MLLFAKFVLQYFVQWKESHEKYSDNTEYHQGFHHLLHKIDKVVDFSHIYNLVEELYCLDNGRPSCDPVVLFKIVIIQHLYGIPSLRRTVEEIHMNVAYRWFLGYTMAEKIPHFAMISYNFKHRFTEQTIEEVFHKGDHKKQFAYEVHTACDQNGYILDVEVTAGNVHDSTAFELYYDRLIEEFPQIEYIVMDTGYKTPAVARKVFKSKRIPVLPYKRPNGKDGYFRPYEYVYDCVICPENQVLKYSTTNRNGYKEFKSCSQICEQCSTLARCTQSKSHQKTVLKHIWMDCMELVEDIRHTSGYDNFMTREKKRSSGDSQMRKRSMGCVTPSSEASPKLLSGSGLSLLP